MDDSRCSICKTPFESRYDSMRCWTTFRHNKREYVMDDIMMQDYKGDIKRLLEYEFHKPIAVPPTSLPLVDGRPDKESPFYTKL